MRHGRIYQAALLCLLSACSILEQDAPERPRISYNVVQCLGTKAADIYPLDCSFISTAFLLEEGKTWAADHNGSQVYINAATISYDAASSCWRDLTKTHYWPRTGKLNFLSYSPASVKPNATADAVNGITISSWDVDANQETDIMVADVQTEQTSNSNLGLYTGVPTIFRHKLSCIASFGFNTLEDYSNGHDGSVSAPYESEDRVFFVNRIRISGLQQTGTYISSFDVGSAVAKVGYWTVDTGVPSCTYTWYDSGTSEGIRVIYSVDTLTPVPSDGLSSGLSYLMVLPQAFSDPGDVSDWTGVPNMEISYTVRTYTSSDTYSDLSKTANVSLYDMFDGSDHKINLNRRINVRITFNQEADLITWAPDQEDWTTGEFSLII
ncbi:MAG: fimbrillin family protein [Candidatus Cryptobacteroides sp.]